jgi:hypothetical protein
MYVWFGWLAMVLPLIYRWLDLLQHLRRRRWVSLLKESCACFVPEESPACILFL